ncbi:hypothetical protein Esti_004413 [Eimeria stiedai]
MTRSHEFKPVQSSSTANMSELSNVFSSNADRMLAPLASSLKAMAMPESTQEPLPEEGRFTSSTYSTWSLESAWILRADLLTTSPSAAPGAKFSTISECTLLNSHALAYAQIWPEPELLGQNRRYKVGEAVLSCSSRSSNMKVVAAARCAAMLAFKMA